ncbi:Wzz/FepE/Etk N-terminal domain-containing protein [Aeromonas dhakensis]|nr:MULTISPECIES: Wzz/FepE/Etk N-terminal domain-containing protein [Aeromonas]EGX6956490.1 lipopolysaccharide biosynthesis protein [Aeromonas hydrophila]KYQ10015.1 lipopolysaccharide biosynthesis protein [Aeromonas hydrophila]KYQ13420.1 lipopolysaccharide biosynthesis protein [Aeromonas hydrophila]KYQ15709.1 lipopolysaccharide biosynthesis protein [Aeromonas hydrophila]KYQ20570.1 lipopolysaccharide biosynthesis protein [Aeromonas hydrophila]
MAQLKEYPPLTLAMNGGKEDEIDLRELFAALWRGKWWIVASTLVGAGIAVIFALSLPNIYHSEALLAPSTEQQGGGLAAMAAQFGGLASLAGVNLSGGGGLDKTAIAVEIGKSRQFLSHFIRQHQLEVPLMAVIKADKVTGELLVDKNIYDVDTKKWVREVPPSKSVEPTDWELVKAFRALASISQDTKSGLVTVAVEYYSPETAKQWVDWLVADLNEGMKLRDQTDAIRNISYLKAQLEKTPVADMQKVFYQLIEEQTKTLMLTEVNQEYVFKTLDPAVVAEEKAKPKRALIAVLGTLLGGMLGVMIALVRHSIGRPPRH